MKDAVAMRFMDQLDSLAKVLDLKGSEIFSWYVKQQYMDFFGMLLGFILLLIIVGVFVRAHFKLMKEYKKDLDKYQKFEDQRSNNRQTNPTVKPEEPFRCALTAVVLGIVAVIVMCVVAVHGVSLFNAERGAFEALIQTLSTVLPS